MAETSNCKFRNKGIRGLKIVYNSKSLCQAHNELKADLYLQQPLFGQCAAFFFDAAFVDRLDLSNVDDALARKVGFALVEHYISG